MQARLLTRLRDEGPLSKAELADRLQVSRTTIQVAVPKRIVLNAPVVTADNVDQYYDLGFES